MILLSHPMGNSFVRALLRGFQRRGMDYSFYTTLAFDNASWWTSWMPSRAKSEIGRRLFDIPGSRCKRHPARELGRLLLSRCPGRPWVGHETGPFSVDAVYQDLDQFVARELGRSGGQIRAVYAYEDGAHETFAAARLLGMECCYELPIAYWETSRRLLQEEAQRWPEWEPTLLGTRDSEEKLERKSDELRWADLVVCPSSFAHQSLPEAIRSSKRCLVAEFGSPVVSAEPRERAEQTGPLRVLFAGSMTQRKGLADLFAAMKLLPRSDLELVVMGSLLLPLEFYRRHCPHFRYEPTRSHEGVLALMRTCDVLVLPSIVEGRALVQQEAMSCGLPIIATPNAGGEDLIEAGRTGFLVPIRAPAEIAAKLAWFADHRSELPAMRACAREKAMGLTWERYADKIIDVLPRGQTVGLGANSPGALLPEARSLNVPKQGW